MRTPFMGVLAPKYSPHASSSDDKPKRIFGERSLQSAIHRAAEIWKWIAIKLNITRTGMANVPVFQPRRQHNIRQAVEAIKDTDQ
jgi:hypothetical protein